jgi:RNA 2',3'-cyclic 3'-phosphodiesterase
MRVFAGLPLPEAVAASVVTALAPARARFPARWVPGGNLHVTLRFFGDLEDAAVAAVKETLDHPELHRLAIASRLGAAGQFPPRGIPCVLWIGVDKGGAEVRAFWETLERLLAPLERAGGPLEGLPRENRDFTPHITVARPGNSLIPSGWAAGTAIPAEDFLFSECILYQSLLGREGAQYIALKRVTLEKGAS